MKHAQSQSGFSLVEALVSITILLIIIVGPMKISSNAAKSTSFASEQVTAFFLAQEGIELVQKARDDLFVQHFLLSGANTDPWGEFIRSNGAYADCFESDGCGLETSGQASGILVTPKDCNGNSADCLLYFDTDTASIRSRYTHNGSGSSKTPSVFTRRIYLEKLPAPNDYEVRVFSEVTWRTGTIKNEQKATVETYLLNTYANN